MKRIDEFFIQDYIYKILYIYIVLQYYIYIKSIDPCGLKFAYARFRKDLSKEAFIDLECARFTEYRCPFICKIDAFLKFYETLNFKVK